MTTKNFLHRLPILLLSTIYIFISSIAHGQTLRDQLQAKASAGKSDQKIKALMNEAIEDLRKSKIKDRAKKVGDKFPNFELKNNRGELVDLNKLLKKGMVIVTFYRGSWCPYCNIQLMEYQKHVSKWQEMGATLLAISPELPELANELAQKRSLTFDLLFDKDNAFAQKVGLVFGIKNDLKAVYEKFGIDLMKSQGNSSWKLPVSATYVIGKDQKVKYAFVDVDYKNRAEPSEIEVALTP